MGCGFRLLTASFAAVVLFTAGCTSVFDYRLETEAEAAERERERERERDMDAGLAGANMDMSMPSSQSEIWRRGDARVAADGGEPDLSTQTQTRSTSREDGGVAPPRDAATPRQEDAAAVDSAVPPAVEPSVARKQAGWDALVDWAGLPTFSDARPLLFSTHERDDSNVPVIDPGNKDFNSFLAVCGSQPSVAGQQNDQLVECQTGESGYLIAADDGPGYVSRILLARGITNPASTVLVDLRPTNERIRIHVDGAITPVFEGLWSELADASTAPFTQPLAGWTSGGIVSYVPISYSSRLRVFIDDLSGSNTLTLYYAQVNTQRVAATATYAPEELASASAQAELDALLSGAYSAGDTWLDQEVQLDGQGTWTVWERAQPGTLQRIELSLERANAAELLNTTALRITWDDAAPAIDLPLALIFGARHALAPVSTLPLSVQIDDSAVRLQLALPMPFAQRARVELAHTGDSARSLQLRLVGRAELPRADWGRLYASYNERSAPQAGERFELAALSGRGKYVGTLLYARGQADMSRSVRVDELGFLEGDERLEIDGRVAALGTGTDNYFNGGFYFKDGLFSGPFAALTQLSRDEATATSEVTLLRWNILSEQLPFQEQLALSFELGADRPGTLRDIAAVSFYYQ
jgi:hypothetical protein